MQVEISERGYTGKRDLTGDRIFEGDVLEEWYNQFYGYVRSLVMWDSEKAGFISEGTFWSESGWKGTAGGWSSLNAEHFSKCRRLGSSYDEPKLLKPAKKMPCEMNQHEADRQRAGVKGKTSGDERQAAAE